MHSVADDIRSESARTTARLSPLERIALALRLGDSDLELYRSAHGASVAEARAAFGRARCAGRIRSRANDPDS